jgi:chromosome segregation ATPase
MSRLADLFGARDQRLLAIESRLEEHAERLNSQRDQLQRQRQRLDEQQQRLDRQRARMREEVEKQDGFRTDVARLNARYPVLEQQMSSMETRLQQLLDAADTGRVTATEAEQAEAKNLLEEVRREHSVIRVRFGAISRYEERMRRLEAAIEPLPEQFPSSRDQAGAT